MTSWLAKFRISAALDSNQPTAEKLKRQIADDAELQRFARRTEALGRVLAVRPAPPQPPLHDGIMRAVRASANRAPARRGGESLLLTTLPAFTALAAMAGICVWLAARPAPPPEARPLAGPGTFLEMSEKMPDTMSSAMLAPLTNEWALMDQDLKDTTQALLANLR